MSTKKNVDAMEFLTKLVGKPLTFGSLVETVRHSREMSQRAFAKKLKISPSHLCDIEKDRKTVGPGRAAKFARILGESENQFVRFAIQGMLDEAGIKMKVEIRSA